MISYDVAIIGAGHAGCEAAYVAARMGMKTLLITLNIDNIAFMPCAPAVGGVGKGHLVKEIDAFDGLMGYIADMSALQYKTLNTSKGLAVHSTRAQVDKHQYKSLMRMALEAIPNIHIRQALITEIIIKNGKFCGLKDNFGFTFTARCCIIATGTFLSGLIHIGDKTFPAGRAGEFASYELPQFLKRFGLQMGRFKTGTGPRLKASSIDFSQMELRMGDGKPRPFSYRSQNLQYKEYPCYVTYTNSFTHKLILDNLDKSALYSGRIEGTPVRYCPSLEDKVVKFKDKLRHQVILEPEGRNTDEIYVSGLGNSMPPQIQENIIRSPKGLEKAIILRPAYAIEYDYLLPHQLKPSLESKEIEGLFFAGQINGTTGYEEASAQGLIAGINSALKILDKPPLIIDRSEGYIGVMIDDLVTKGTDEPYRIFTSRAEYRLILREDNVYYRLSEKAHKLGLISDERMKNIEKELEKAEKLRLYLKETKIKDNDSDEIISMEMKIKRGQLDIRDSKELYDEYPLNILNYVQSEVKYEGYIEKQKREIEKLKKLEKTKIPYDFDYDLPGLSIEIREKLNKIRPKDLAQASRIPGMTPSSLSLLIFYLKKTPKDGHECSMR